jgi:ribosomal RNA-processing protein 36
VRVCLGGTSRDMSRNRVRPSEPAVHDDARPVKRSRTGAPVRIEEPPVLLDDVDEGDAVAEDELEVDEEDEDEDDDEAEDARAALREVPLGQLAQLRADGRGDFGGPKLRTGGAEGRARAARVARANKNRPVEQSSKRPVSRLHIAPGLEALAQRHRPLVSRDPRFDEAVAGAGGSVTDSAFRKRYAFLYDEQLPQEKAQLKALLKVRSLRLRLAGCFSDTSIANQTHSFQREKRPERRDALRSQLLSIEQSLKQETQRRGADSRAAVRHRRERDAVAAGKKPFYLKKADAKREDLLAQFQELQKSGKLDKFLAKRRQKLATKDHVHAPMQGGPRRRTGGRDEEP